VSDEKSNGTPVPDDMVDTDTPYAPGSPEHILGMIAHQLKTILHNQTILAQGVAMLLSSGASLGVKREDVIAQMQKLDPRMEITQSPLVKPAGGFRPKIM
jgi:hypothetical protein